MRSITSRHLAIFTFTALLSPIFAFAGNSIQIEKQLASDELPTIPNAITTNVYTSVDANIPVAIQTYYAGEWQLVREGQSRSLIVSMETIAPHDRKQALWFEMAADGTRLGERTRLRIPGVPDFSAEGLIESRSLVEGGFKYPDGSIQTAAMDASCNPGSSIRSISPDGTFSCEPGGLPIGASLNCAAANKMTGIESSGNVICAGDIDTTYTAGTGLSLLSGQFSASFGTTSTHVAVGNHLHAGTYLPVGSSLTCGGNQKVSGLSAAGNVECGTDINTIYSAGSGLQLIGSQFSANFGTGSTQVAVGNHTHVVLKELAEKEAELDDLRARVERLEAMILKD